MRVTLAAYVYVEREGGRSVHVCQAARTATHSTRDPLLGTALSKLGNKLRKNANERIREGKTARLGTWLYDPNSQSKVCKLHLILRDRTLRLKLLLVIQPAFGRYVVYSPAIADVDFELEALSQLEDRATEVYARWAQKQLSEGLSISVHQPSDMWIEPIEVDLETSVPRKKKSKNIFAALMGGEKMNGNVELHKVGQCLDEMVGDYAQVIGRDELVEEADSMLKRGDRQGVLIVGPRSVGKTAIIQECARRRMERYQEKRGTKPQVWWLSPQRLISGMSYLGQWEQRWLSILREATRRDHILYFDDLVGLFTAGCTRDSSLSAADVLRSYWAENKVRIVAEATDEQLAILRRRDRSLADRFHLLHVPSFSAEDALPIVLESTYNLEPMHECHFHPETIPLVMRHQEIYSPDRAFPGKAIEMCQTMAKQSTQVVAPSSFFNLAGTQAGANMQLLLGRLGDQTNIQRSLNEHLIGQPEAVEALSKVAIRFSQHMQAPDRPLGVFLFLGPTGVGKTESAKALTRLLYQNANDENHLVRIDMNELTTPLAVEQLVGTFDQPDGRLTSAVRRRPNCIILLDEIEKAHPDVFDLLLQVIGEGRLTDARGRVADFRSSIIIMTSNLGVTEQSSGLGFETSGERRTAVYEKAARSFFRPEFVNRIDEIVAFRNLTKENLESIVRLQMQDILARDGFKRRDIFVHVADSAIDRVIQSGFDPQLGARAIRRKIEREVIGPLGDCLSGSALTHPALVQITGATANPFDTNALSCHVTALDVVKPKHSPFVEELELLIARGHELHDALAEQIGELRGPLQEEDRSYGEKFEDASYYALREQLRNCTEWLKLAEMRKQRRRKTSIDISQAQLSRPRIDGQDSKQRELDKHSLQDMQAVVNDRESQKALVAMSSGEFARSLIDCFALTKAMVDHALGPRTWLLGFRQPLGFESAEDALQAPETLPEECSELRSRLNFLEFDYEMLSEQEPEQFVHRLSRCLRNQWQYETSHYVLFGGYSLVSGFGLEGLLRAITGIYRIEFEDQPLRFLELEAHPVPHDQQPPTELWKRTNYNPSMDTALDSLRSLLKRTHGDRQEIQDSASRTDANTRLALVRGLVQATRVVDFATGAELQLPANSWVLTTKEVAPLTARWWTRCLPVPDPFRVIGERIVTTRSVSEE